jgi:hypothetical protein
MGTVSSAAWGQIIVRQEPLQPDLTHLNVLLDVVCNQAEGTSKLLCRQQST